MTGNGEQRAIVLCGQRALGCGPCELLALHGGRHLCSHYAMNGVEYHDPADSWCGCPTCRKVTLTGRTDP